MEVCCSSCVFFEQTFGEALAAYTGTFVVLILGFGVAVSYIQHDVTGYYFSYVGAVVGIYFRI